MKFLIFLCLMFPTSVFAKTFEQATEGWNCVYDVELGVRDKSIVTGDFCIDGTYNVIGVEQSTEGQMAVRAKISDTGESITGMESGGDYVIGPVTRSGCMMGFSLNHCAIYSSPPFNEVSFEIVIQGPIMNKKPGTWMSPEINIAKGTVLPINGEYFPQGIIDRMFLEVENPMEVSEAGE